MLVAILLLGVVNHAFAETKVSKSTKKICQIHYEKYKINQEEFNKKFSNKRYYDDCMSLYADSHWYFRGKSKIDQKYR